MKLLLTVRAAATIALILGLGSSIATGQTRPAPKPPAKIQPPTKTTPPTKAKPKPTEPAKPIDPKPEPKSLPETSRLQNELSATKQRLQPVIARVQKSLSATQSVRSQVRNAITTTKRIAQIDDAMKRMIRQLTPVAKLPPTRSIDPLVDALTAVQKQFHVIRVKADSANKKVLTPTDNKLKSAETGLASGLAKLKDGARKIDETKAHATKLRGIVASRGDQPADVQTLETLAKTTRAALPPVDAGVKVLDDASEAIERDLDKFGNAFAALAKMSPVIEQFWDAIEPVNKAARELDKTLNERIEIDVLGEKIGFTVRQILEGPGNVADAVLKPLEKLAEDAVKPILKALKLEIKPPKELTAIGEALDALTELNLPGLEKLQAALADKSVDNLIAALATYMNKKSIP